MPTVTPCLTSEFHRANRKQLGHDRFHYCHPEFIPDLAGTYVMQLIVNDGFGGISDPSTVTIQVTVNALSVIKAIQTSLLPTIQQLPPPPDIRQCQHEEYPGQQAQRGHRYIEAGNYAEALSQLQHDLLGKVDGVANSGKPDKNDWIKDPAAQTEVYNCLMRIIAELKVLL